MIDFTQQAPTGSGNKPLDPPKIQYCCAQDCPISKCLSSGEVPSIDWTCQYHSIAKKKFWPDVTNNIRRLFNIYVLACALREGRVNGQSLAPVFTSQEKSEIASTLERCGASELFPKPIGEEDKQKYAERI
ncbi:MAG: hypothetical protein LUC43_03540, partial [Burkholderiales bacterium]|nr:hypothetical protein [Burkholderiales bacterium]